MIINIFNALAVLQTLGLLMAIGIIPFAIWHRSYNHELVALLPMPDKRLEALERDHPHPFWGPGARSAR
jgi:hypothetical protein